MTKVVSTFAFIMYSFFSVAQQATRTIYRDSLGHNMSANNFQEATNSGILASMQMSVKGDTVIRILKLEAKSEQKKRADEEADFKKRLLGTPLPDIPLKRLDGSSLNLSSLKGRTLAINFWFIQCAPCVSEIPELNELTNHYRNNSQVLFFAAALDEHEALKKFLGKRPFSYMVLGHAKEFCEKIGVPAYPTNIIVDSNGLISEVIVGGKEEIGKVLTEAIDRVLANANSK